jgi:hypothetical protein
MRRFQAAWVGSLLIGIGVGLAPAARANDVPAASNEGAGVCMGDPALPLERANMINEIQQQLAAKQESDGEGIRLNTSGYRYDSDQAPSIARDLQLLDIEMRRARAAAKSEGRLP